MRSSTWCWTGRHRVRRRAFGRQHRAVLPATLAERLGIEQATDHLVTLGERPGRARPGRKLLTLMHAMVAGADCIDNVELLRCGSTASVLGHRVMATSTVGTWLRGFTFGHVCQLDRLTETILGRAWAAGAGPGDGPLTVDVNSTICEVHGYHKQGACYGYTRGLGYHPLLATRADAGEVLHARLRKGSANTARGIARFVDELVARLRRAGASGELTLRMDSGFWSAKLIKRLRGHRVRYSITVRQTKSVRAAIAGIPEAAWVQIAYQPDGSRRSPSPLPGRSADRASRSQPRRSGPALPHLAVSRVRYRPTRRHDLAGRRPPPPRRVRAGHPRPQGGRRAGPPAVGPVRGQQRVALAATLAHNLLRRTASLGLGSRDQQTLAKTLRRTLLHLPGRLTRSAHGPTLHLPADRSGPPSWRREDHLTTQRPAGHPHPPHSAAHRHATPAPARRALPAPGSSNRIRGSVDLGSILHNFRSYLPG
jgi:hypothetical protein